MSAIKLINWPIISILGNNPIVTRSYIYLIIVPILAKLLSALESPFLYNFTSGYTLKIPLGLPFNWVLFYFAAFFFTIGTIIYVFFAPQIIKEDKTFGDFEVKRKTSIHLKLYLDDLGISDKYIKEQTKIDATEIQQKNISQFAPGEIIKAISDWWSGNSDKNLSKKVQLYYDYWRTQSQTAYPLQNLFWDIYQYAKNVNFVALILAFIFYALGILLIVIVLIQSMRNVLTAIIH